MKTIEIKCEGKSAVNFKILKPFQDNLKDLSQVNYEKLKGRILALGFSEPISVWVHKDNHYILNGHQRLRAIQKMVDEEGYECPDLPINFVSAKNIKQAKEKVLALASQYGEVTDQGLYEFLQTNEIDYTKLNEELSFPEIDTKGFIEGYYSAPSWVDPDDDKESHDYDERSKEDKIDEYMNSEIVHLKLPYEREEFKAIVANLDRIGVNLQIQEHSIIISKLIEAALADPKD